jgi:cytochrome c peroxidase
MLSWSVDSALRVRGLVVCVALLALGSAAYAQDADPAEVTLGERLFLETRFAEFFARNSLDVNAPLAVGDPVVAQTLTTSAPLPGPFAGESISCRSCHLVDEQLEEAGGGMRSYADFARRSPVSARADGKTTAARNSPSLVNASLPRPGGIILHFDGEFPTLESLVRGTLTGRNYGWLPAEASFAVAHIARVVKADDGSGALAQEFGGAYRAVLGGVDPSLPPEFVLPAEFRVDVDRASDSEIVDAVARLIAVYVEQLVFAQDPDGAFDGSPYDAFLARNRLPRAPRRGESPAAYTARLRRALNALRAPVFVADGPFEFHAQNREFGALELRGLRVFLRQAPLRPLRSEEIARGGVGNCASCHAAPNFTDFSLHNTGATQLEYDALHGAGAFARLPVPALTERNADPDRWLPATAAHPNAAEPFRAAPSAADARLTDLGVWNVFANPDMPAAQAKLARTLCLLQRERAAGLAGDVASAFSLCSPAALLERALAAFKTPGLRDLSHSAPYLHTGEFDSLEAVVGFYRRAADEARRGSLRNAAPELRGIALRPEDAQALAAFLRSLNEDYN